MRNYTTILLAIGAALSPLCAQDENDPEPEKLTSLRQSWLDAKERDARPIKDGYLTALISLRKELTKLGKLEDAVLVQDEITALTQGQPGVRAEEGNSAGTRELISLRSTFVREMALMSRKHDRTYIDALKKMGQDFMKKGELEPALVVQAELERVKGSKIGVSIPKEATEWRGHFYLMFEEKATWKEAVDRCKKLQGHLVTVTSREEAKLILKLTGGHNSWLGASDEEHEGKWQWVTGEEFEFTDWWHRSIPDNYQGRQHFLRFRGDGWDDDFAESKYGFICEWEPEIP